ncbi:hypothetical protein ACFXDJ_06740 [Streptomyces sp. NPDC059443]|uniref:hypothetical protein n=1 Tax=unclassified Streptomyces TaxID=2593676 RepID=UPI00368DA186
MREDEGSFGEAMAILSSFASYDMKQDATRMLVWLDQAKLDVRTGLPIRDYTRRVPNRAFTAYTVARLLADDGLIVTPPGWDNGTADISLTARGRACVNHYGGNVNEYTRDNPQQQPSIRIGNVGEGSAVNFGSGAITAAKGATVNAGAGAQQSTSGVDSGDLIAVLSLIRANMPMQTDQDFMDEVIADAQGQEDTPSLRRRMWQAITGYIARNEVIVADSVNGVLEQLNNNF